MCLVCAKCGQPWTLSFVLQNNPNNFKREEATILACPCCQENLQYQEKFLSKKEKEILRERLILIKEVCDLNGDNINRAAFYLKKFKLNLPSFRTENGENRRYLIKSPI